MGCIYKRTNQINGKAYIGKSHVDVMERQKKHNRGQGSRLLKQAIDKYGINNFTFEILHDGILDEFLDDFEREAIKRHNTVAPNGYNLTWGGEGGKISDEARQKHREAKIGENNPMYRKSPSAETRRRISKALQGRKRPKEVCRRISEANRNRCNETRQKLSQALSGENNPMYGKTGKKSPHYGKSCPEETRHKISKSLRRPEYSEALNFFRSLPSEMPIKEKRKHLYAKYPYIKERTIRRWIQQWHPAETQVS